MISQQNKDNIILKDVHCPYCGSDNALLLNRAETKKVSLQLPAYGLKFILSIIYLSVFYTLVNGYKLFELVKTINNVTYGFCPKCGNTYSMAPPNHITEENQPPKFYRVKDGKVVMGLCKGISEYTGISLFWIRIITVIYGLTVIGAIVYFLAGACIPFGEDAEKGLENRKMLRVRKGKDIMGLCKGFSEYTGIPVAWVRLFNVLFSITIIAPILYFIISAAVPFKEDVEQGIEKKKLYKVKEGKFLLGFCKGFSEYANVPLWLVRVVTVILSIVTCTLFYFIAAAIIPTKEDDYE